MKKFVYNLSALTVMGGLFLLSSCTEDDTTAPELSLLGEATLTHALDEEYTDAGAEASDTEDGDLTDDIEVTGTVDINTAGTYTLEYNVSDKAGNAADAVTRTVYVTYTGADLAATYDATDVCDSSGTNPYESAVTASSSDVYLILVNDFADFFTSSVDVIVKEGNVLELEYQNPDGDTWVVEGEGTVDDAGSTLTIDFTITDNADGWSEDCSTTFEKK